jgi:hypothetical protein
MCERIYKRIEVTFFSTTNGPVQSKSLKNRSYGAACDRLGCNLHIFNCNFFDSPHLCSTQVAALQAHWCEIGQVYHLFGVENGNQRLERVQVNVSIDAEV